MSEKRSWTKTCSSLIEINLWSDQSKSLEQLACWQYSGHVRKNERHKCIIFLLQGVDREIVFGQWWHSLTVTQFSSLKHSSSCNTSAMKRREKWKELPPAPSLTRVTARNGQPNRDMSCMLVQHLMPAWKLEDPPLGIHKTETNHQQKDSSKDNWVMLSVLFPEKSKTFCTHRPPAVSFTASDRWGQPDPSLK